MKKALLICFSLLVIPMVLLAKNNMSLSIASTVIYPPGDTIVFNTKDYVIQPNDKLDDLLKRLPVISMDNKGIFYSQNAPIEMFLVDGQEFFTNNILIGARQLRADEVDKIVIYWRWSDQTSFTGVEDNTKKIKTLNVIMKKTTSGNKK